MYKIITYLKFLDILTWFRNATAWASTPKMILGKHAYYISPYRAKSSYVAIAKICVPLTSVQL